MADPAGPPGEAGRSDGGDETRRTDTLPRGFRGDRDDPTLTSDLPEGPTPSSSALTRCPAAPMPAPPGSAASPPSALSATLDLRTPSLPNPESHVSRIQCRRIRPPSPNLSPPAKESTHGACPGSTSGGPTYRLDRLDRAPAPRMRRPEPGTARRWSRTLRWNGMLRKKTWGDR
jgi:hypothetical protein